MNILVYLAAMNKFFSRSEKPIFRLKTRPRSPPDRVMSKKLGSLREVSNMVGHNFYGQPIWQWSMEKYRKTSKNDILGVGVFWTCH